MDRPGIALFALAALLVCAAPAAGEPAVAEKRRDIEELLRVVRWDPGPESRAPDDRDLAHGPSPRAGAGVARGGAGRARGARSEERTIALHARLYTAEALREHGYELRDPAPPTASPGGGGLTIDENGRVYRRPKVVQPNE